ncbi:7277_t:CDS:1, partial [Dentiscutata erythropus]
NPTITKQTKQKMPTKKPIINLMFDVLETFELKRSGKLVVLETNAS